MYAEINNNGRLNVKLSFDDIEDQPQRQQRYEDAARRLSTCTKSSLNPLNLDTKSMTVLSLEIGLANTNGLLHYAQDCDFAVKHLLAELPAVYARRRQLSI